MDIMENDCEAFLGRNLQSFHIATSAQEPSPTKYYCRHFGAELLSVMCLEDLVPGERLSLIVLHPNEPSSGFNWRAQHTSFINLERKMEFVFCYFLVSLFDQTLHFCGSPYHRSFEVDTCYPKPVGVLSGYHYIWHPKHLLHIASYWARKDKVRDPREIFGELLTVYFNDCERCLDDFQEPLEPIYKVFLSEFSTDVDLDHVYPPMRSRPDLQLVRDWVNDFREEVDQKVAQLSE